MAEWLDPNEELDPRGLEILNWVKVTNIVHPAMMNAGPDMPTTLAIVWLLSRKKEVTTALGFGNGPIDAAVVAIKHVIEGMDNLELTDFSVQAVEQGTDALGKADITITSKDDDLSITGSSTDHDIVTASMKAVIQAAAKIRVLQEGQA